jgi:hypothetical protein
VCRDARRPIPCPVVVGSHMSSCGDGLRIPILCLMTSSVCPATFRFPYRRCRLTRTGSACDAWCVPAEPSSPRRTLRPISPRRSCAIEPPAKRDGRVQLAPLVFSSLVSTECVVLYAGVLLASLALAIDSKTINIPPDLGRRRPLCRGTGVKYECHRKRSAAGERTGALYHSACA